MKNSRIAVKPILTPECVVCLAPTIAALKTRFPGSAVGIVADESLREASLLLPELDFFATEAESTHADHVIDLTGSERYEDSAEDSNWKAYLLASNSLPAGNPYHLADLLKKCARVDTVDVNFELALPESAAPLPDAFARASGVKIAICTGSLSAAEVEATLEAISRLASAAEVFLLGTVKDKKLSSHVTATWDGRLNVHDFCGHLSLLGHAAALRTCDLTITGPGLSAAMSAGFGTFTVCVDDQPIRGPLLYPYGHGHLVVQRSVTGPVAGSLASFLQELVTFALNANAGSVPSLEQWQQFADSMIFGYLGKLRLEATQRIEIVFKDTGSFTELYQRPLLFTGSELYDVFQTFYRLLWEHSLSQRTITTFDLQILHQDTMPLLCDLLKPLEQLFELANFGQTYSGYVRESLASGDMVRAKHESERLQEVEELLQALVSTQPYLLPLYTVFQQEQRLLEGETPLKLADEMAALFSGLKDRVLVLLDLAKTLFHTVFESESASSGGTKELSSSSGPDHVGAIEKADSND